MKRMAAALAIGLLASCGSTTVGNPTPSGATTTATSTVKEKLPTVTLKGLNGEDPLTVSDLKGTPTVINLWASWCGPCKTELPILARAHTSYGAKVRMIGIDFDDGDSAAAIDLARTAGVTYPLYADPKSRVRSDLAVIGLPQTVFVDGQGTIVATERLAFRSYADLTAAIEKHLGVKP